MTFSPVVFGTGLVGWSLLQRTSTAQKQVLSQDTAVQRDVSNFRNKFGGIETASQLIKDRQLLSVALGAFGLQDDIDNKYFLQRILEDGTEDRNALANLLSDNRYRDFAETFSFPVRDIDRPTIVETTISSYVDQSFEAAVGEQNSDYRLALNLHREIADIANSSTSNDTKWFTIMGSPPLRKVFEVAFRLPSSVGSLPIDDQLELFKNRSNSTFGTSDVSDFSDTSSQDRIVNNFLLQSQLAETKSLDPRSTALTLLQTGRISIGAI
ncbi:DUF1217 domain-containing protein [uncultured Litoreibacter sp.]|uniref:DUF1217 domain-containing protein n=1 Tax=uncultured Litoreibacter sp. TaxID=1392394 RepID=UPI00261878BF|nr:DUF1217 domain-containing protein [uncultured Litoreibacter sp.]